MMTSLRGWLVFVLLPVFIGGIVWLSAPAPPPPKQLRLATEQWTLPPAPKAQAGKAVEILNKNSLWGKLPEVAGAKPLTDPAWRFLGIVTSGPERFVLIKIEGLPEKSLRINDSLPGGSKILAIENDKICILIEGKKRSLGIYKTGPQDL
jgi:hypothetical protein